MNGLITNLESDCSEFVEVDPTGRYGRYNEILGKGASKIVYRAFDECQGIEVAWNQVKLYDFLQSPEDLERLYCEIHLLKTLKHRNIMKFYMSWVDTANRNINFVTEMFTSGTLRQYRLKHKRVNIRAVKHWCRQILEGLLYLHSHDPPVIHRDLKCDNIFINGNQGEVKIGDLGLAAILRKSHADHCVGTPEFMAPEVYQEAYNELVDIYSFGMCVLEMVTFEYPYSECNHPAQIYKKVISGRKPDALYKVKDPKVRQFVMKCLATVPSRLSAAELLDDPFLRMDDCEYDLRPLDYREELTDMGPLIRQPYLAIHRSNSILSADYLNGYGKEEPREWDSLSVEDESNGIELFECHDDEQTEDMEISIKGKRKDDGSIFLRLRIADKEGRIRNIYFPFDVETDTALSVATEMIAELDITDQDVIRIADMIDGEIASLVPEWRPGPGYEDTPRHANQFCCQNCASNHTSSGSLLEFLSHNGRAKNLQLLQCSTHGCAAMRGRFGEITFQSEDSEHQPAEALPTLSEHSQDIPSQHESRELTPMGSASHSDEEFHESEKSVSKEDRKQRIVNYRLMSDAENQVKKLSAWHSFSAVHSFYNALEDIEQKAQQELRWLRASFQQELRELRYMQLGMTAKSFVDGKRTQKTEATASPSFSIDQISGVHCKSMEHNRLGSHCSSHTFKSCPISETQRGRNCVAIEPSTSSAHMFIDKSFSTGSLLPHCIHRTMSLLVDAVDI